MPGVSVRNALLGALALGAACASTTAPLPVPEERLVVLNAGDNTLSVISVDSEAPARRIALGAQSGGVTDVAARGQTAVVAASGTDRLLVVDLQAENVRKVIPLEPGSRPNAVVFVSDVVVYVTNAIANTVTRVDLTSGDTASVVVGRYPRDLALTRGRLFVVNGNVVPCPAGTCSLGPSWLTVVDPQTNALAAGVDSIPLPSQGNARSVALGGDGLLYVINTGDVAAAVAGRLSIVDPIRREEVGSFGGFGFIPAALASDGSDRLFVTSPEDGLMEFNTRNRRVVRGAGQGVLVADVVAAAVDSDRRIYAVEAGNCAGGGAGRLRIFRPDLTEARAIPLGPCPVGAALVQLSSIFAATE